MTTRQPFAVQGPHARRFPRSLMLLAVLSLLGGVSCSSDDEASSDDPAPGGQAAAPTERSAVAAPTTVTTAPPGPADTALAGLSIEPGGMFPAFRPEAHDYAIPCKDGTNSLRVDATAAEGATVKVADANDRGEVSVDEGELVRITTSVGDDTSDYWVRCLPADFPPLTVDRPSEPAKGWYLLSPSLDFQPQDPTALLSYAVILDTYGAPVWYQRVVEDLTEAGGYIIDFKRLPNGNLAWKTAKDPFGLNDLGYNEYDLDGKAVATWKTVDSPTDHHDLLQLPSGNMMMISYHQRDDVDASALGFDEPSTVVDGWLQEITPEGDVVWEWRSEDHLSFDEVPETIRKLENGVSQTVLGPGGTQQVFVDPVHPNSVELDPDTGDVIMSARSANAVYKIRRNPGGDDDGDVLWKLGGNEPAGGDTLDLEIIDDPLNGPVAQHDARITPEGYVSVFDNRSGQQGEPARAVVYQVDEDAGTARMVSSISEPGGANSESMGSASVAGDGSVVVGWGRLSTLFTEFDRDGTVLLDVRSRPDLYTYKVQKVQPEVFDATELRERAG